MIATSVLFLAAAIATFLVGVFSTGLQMIGASIGCSVAAAVLLLVGVMRDSRRRPAIAPSSAMSSPELESYVAPTLPEDMQPMEPVPATEAAFSSTGAIDLESAREDLYSAPATESFEPAPAISPATRVRKPATRKPAARKPAAKKAAPKKAAAKKAAPKKAAARKPAAKSTAKKTATRKPATRKPSAPGNE